MPFATRSAKLSAYQIGMAVPRFRANMRTASAMRATIKLRQNRIDECRHRKLGSHQKADTHYGCDIEKRHLNHLPLSDSHRDYTDSESHTDKFVSRIYN